MTLVTLVASNDDLASQLFAFSDALIASELAAAAARKGDFAVLWIRNFREAPSTCNPSPDDDWTHFWPVGVYVDRHRARIPSDALLPGSFRSR